MEDDVRREIKELKDEIGEILCEVKKLHPPKTSRIISVLDRDARTLDNNSWEFYVNVPLPDGITVDDIIRFFGIIDSQALARMRFLDRLSPELYDTIISETAKRIETTRREYMAAMTE